MVLGASPLAERGVAESRRDVKFLPYHRFEFVSPLKPRDALAAMSAKTEPERLFRWRWPNAANEQRFEGTVGGDRFHVRRVIGYNNSFLPVINGVVHGQGAGSRIVVTMRPLVFAIAFVALWSVIALSMLFSPIWPATFFLLFFIYAFAMAGFWIEAGRQEQTLRKTFKAIRDTTTPLVS
jgi:hypothetical protein